MIRRRKSVFLTLLLSYLVVLIIPVAISAVLYANMERTLVENANRSNLAMLEQVRQIVDNHMKEIDRLIVQVATHPKLQTLWNIDDGESYVEYEDAVKTLRNIRGGTGFIANFFIQLNQSDVILTPDLKTDTTLYLTRLFAYKDKTVEQMRDELFNRYHYKTFWPTMAVTDWQTPKKVITTSVSMPLGERDNVKATLVMMIDEQQIFNLLKQIEWVHSGAMYILDDEGNVIVSSTGKNELPLSLREHMEEKIGHKSYRANGQKKQMLSYTTGQSGWKYVSLVPEAIVLQRVNEMKGWALSLLALCLVGGTVAAYWMAYRSYSPIRNMMYAIVNGNLERTAKSGQLNEYEFIQSSIVQTLEEGKEMKRRLDGHMPVVRAHFLSRLLKGQADSSALEPATLEFLGVSFPHEFVCVVLVEVDDSSEFMKEENEKDRALIRFIIYNLSSDLIGDRGYVTETDRDRLAIILNVSDCSEETKRLRTDFMHELKQMVEGRFRMKISAAASSIRHGIEETSRCYGEALNALDYRIIHGISSVIDFEEIRHLEGTDYQYPVETEVQLMNHIKSGDYDSAARLLDELYEQNVGSGAMTPEMGKCLIFDLLSTMLKVMSALKLDEKQLFDGSADPVKHILNSPSAEAMLRKIKTLCASICESVREARTDQGGRLNERLKRYIEERSSDNALSLTAIAEHFGMSPQYVSGFFKKQNGVNLTDYMTELRIREAKRLLGDSGLTVLQVAQKVGYATDIGFIRVFKKQEGITPGKYRELLLQADDRKNG